MADNRTEYEIALIDKVSSEAQKINDSITKLGKDAEKSFSGAGRAFEIFKGTLLERGLEKGLEIATHAARELFDVFIVDGVKAALEQENAVNKLNTALALAGEFSSQASEDFKDFAESLQGTTKFSNDAILSTGALIESLGQLSESSLEDATLAAANLSAALGVDLETAARKLGLAAEGNVASFKKFGITVAEGSTNAETFANAVDAVNQKFGGSAESQVKTFSGAIAQITNNFDDLVKVFGQAIIENTTFTFALAEVNKIIQELTGSAEDNKDALKTLVAEGFLKAIDAAIFMVPILGAVEKGIRLVAAGFEAAGIAIGATAAAIVQTASGEFSSAFETIKQGGLDSAAVLEKAYNTESSISKIAPTLERIRGAAQAGFKAMQDGAVTAVAPINGTVDALRNLTAEQVRAGEAGQKLANSLIDATALDLAKQKFEVLKAQRSADLIGQQEFITAQKALQDQTNAEEIAQLEAARAQKLIGEAKYQAALAAIRVKSDNQAAIAETERSKEEVSNRTQTLNAISGLMKDKNIELFRIGQAAAISQATIDGFAAAQKALASAPPPFNFVLAGLVGVATAANVIGIASQEPPHFATGGIVPGNSPVGDRVQIMANSGEMVLNGPQQKQLFEMANGGGGANQVAQLLAQLNANIMSLANRPFTIMLDGREVFNSMRQQLNAGRAF